MILQVIWSRCNIYDMNNQTREIYDRNIKYSGQKLAHRGIRQGNSQGCS